MRVGILNSPKDMKEQEEVTALHEAFRRRGHDVIFLNTDEARWDGKDIVYPEFKKGDRLDVFLNWNPCDEEEGKQVRDVPYFTQLRWLDLRYQTPVTYFAQTITCSKIKMNEVFNAIAGLPVPQAYDGTDLLAREKMLAGMEETGRPVVLKPDYGWGGHDIVKISSMKEAEREIAKFEKKNASFLMQDYIECGGVDYRAYVIGNKVAGSIVRTPKPGEWRGNFQLGSTVQAHSLTARQKRDAVKTMKAAKLGFGAVDLLIDPKDGQHYICEINDCAGTTSIEQVHEGLSIATEIAKMTERKYKPS